tara:strand:- start:891 stop:1346 length:456 start_codon:yes stop_codon:yes gene_type:complete
MANIVPDSFKAELLAASHNFEYGVSTDTYKLALYVTTLGPPYTTSSTVYSTTNEVSSVGTNYSAGGNALTLGALSGSVPGSNTAIVDFDNLTFSNVTLTALGAAIYNSSTTPANMLCLVLDFGGDKTATSGDFTIQFPNPTAADAIIRLGD